MPSDQYRATYESVGWVPVSSEHSTYDDARAWLRGVYTRKIQAPRPISRKARIIHHDGGKFLGRIVVDYPAD